MSKLLYQPQMSDTRAPAVWQTVLDHKIPLGMQWANGIGLMWGDGGSIRRSTDGMHWSPVNSVKLANVHIRSVVWTGAQWVGCGVTSDSFATSKVFYSPDGITWFIASEFLPLSAFKAHQIVFDGFNHVLFPQSTATSNYLYYSSDLVNWTKTANGQAPASFAIGSGITGMWTGSQYVVCGSGTPTASTRIFTSSDLVNWTLSTGVSGTGVYGVVTNGSVNVVVGSGGKLYYNYGGTAWSSAASVLAGDTAWTYSGVIWTGSAFFAFGAPSVVQSYNGVNWFVPSRNNTDKFVQGCWTGALLAVTTGLSHAWSDDSGLTYYTNKESCARANSTAGYNSQCVAAAGSALYYATASGRLIRSLDGGETWATTHLDTKAPIRNVYNLGGQYIIQSATPGGLPGVYTSSDGLYWDPRPQVSGYLFSTASPSYSLAFDGTTYIAVGAIGYILRSTDLETWQSAYIGINGRKATWNDTQFLVTAAGYAFRSVSAAGPWVSVTIYPATSTNHIWTGTQYIAINNSGRIYTSTTGATWTLRHTFTSVPLNDLVKGNNRIVIVGNNGLVAYSDDDGLSWTQVVTQCFTTLTTIHSVTWDGSKYWTATNSTACVHRAWSLDGITWVQDAIEYGSTPVTNAKKPPIGNALTAVTNATVYLESLDGGLTWESHQMTASVKDVAVASDGAVVAVGTASILSSSDKVTWNAATIPAGSRTDLLTVDYGAGNFLAAGAAGYQAGAPYPSALLSGSGANGTWYALTNDLPAYTVKYLGTNWFGVAYYFTGSVARYYVQCNFANVTPTGTLTSQRWYDVAYGSATYVAVGVSGNIVTATDPTWDGGWTKRIAYNTDTIYRVQHGDGVFVTVGANSTGHYSYDLGVNWQYTPYPSTLECIGLWWDGTKFVSVTTDGSIFTLTPPP